ncbi:MAG: Eco57I restriction-modification methylase domain-containing protein, partial [Bacteroidaceae bacterium]|nr:Eco57I restriction-modification methylase domain-containing protein [Bacteroidaceae bacterium]
VKICDPAIGSGAFPMGLLKELFLCRTALEGISQHQAAAIKKHIIQQNIYGVDIERGAVDIARLRFWLSLIVDEETPQALPNLDFKIMQGNSLLEQYKGVDFSKITELKSEKEEGVQLSWFEEALDVLRLDLRKKLDEYYNCTDHHEKQALRKDIINNVKQQLREQSININFGDLDLSGNNQFFLWHTWFFDVFSQGGFDIVIGNPPYGAKLSNEEKQCCKKTYKVTQSTKNIKGSTDTFCVFIECGFFGLKREGILSYIVPMSVTSSDAMGQLHELLNQGCESLHIASFSNRPKQIFESAGLRVSIMHLRRTNTCMKRLFTTKLVRRRNSDSLTDILDNLKYESTINYRMPGRYAKAGSKMEIRILDKLFKVNKRLGDYENINGKPIFYRAAGGRYFNVITDYTTNTSAEKNIKVEYTKQIGLCLSSTMFWFYQQVYTDGLNLKSTEIKAFPLPDFNKINKKTLDSMSDLYQSYLTDIELKANVRQESGNSSYNVELFKEYKIVRSMEILDKIDSIVCSIYNLNNEEIEFLKNYEIDLRRSGE